jgi:ectoine hydroxylase-related dioxygenase (phytanoyl-CoA dioxygenase family)
MITEHQQESFAERGLIRMDRLIPDAKVAPVRELVLRVLEEEGFWRDGTWVGPATADWSLRTRLMRSLKDRTKRSAAYKDLVTEGLLEAVNLLVGGRAVRPMTNRPQVLFTPPNAASWTVPHKIWHLDVPRLGGVGLPGVQMFSFLNTVAPGTGGTLVVAGSHRLLNDGGRISSKDVKRRLRREAYFGELLKPGEGDRQRFLDEPGRVGDVELQVVELHGEPGDVFLTDLRLLHTLAPNASRVPRLMVTQRFLLESALDAMTDVDPEIGERPDTNEPAPP